MKINEKRIIENITFTNTEQKVIADFMELVNNEFDNYFYDASTILDLLYTIWHKDREIRCSNGKWVEIVYEDNSSGIGT